MYFDLILVFILIWHQTIFNTLISEQHVENESKMYRFFLQHLQFVQSSCALRIIFIVCCHFLLICLFFHWIRYLCIRYLCIYRIDNMVLWHSQWIFVHFLCSFSQTNTIACNFLFQPSTSNNWFKWKTTQNPPKKRWKNSLQKIKNITSNDFNFNKSAVIRWINSLVHARDFVSRSENSN